jgi:large subunit ribosomal protein L13
VSKIHKTKHKTYMAKATDVEKKCYIVDAKDKILGRVASKCAHVLRGKHKPQFTPFVDTGDMVVIINADKIQVTGKKLTDKFYQRYTGFPSGQRKVSLENMLKNRPTEVLRLAICRMIAPGPMGNEMKTKLRIYAGDKHPHLAQKPVVLEV